MPSPASSMVCTNTGVSDHISVNGNDLAPGDSVTLLTTDITAACSDLNFWAAFLSGVCSVTMNGRGLPATTPAVVAFLIAVAIGDIVPT